MEGKILSSQEIYEKLLNEDKFPNSSPAEIVKSISDYQYKFQEDIERASGIDPETFFKDLEISSKWSEPDENLENLENLLNNDSEEEIKVLEGLDNLSNFLFSKESKKLKFIELDNLLDDLINKEEDINLITFNSEENNIYEIEHPTSNLIDMYKEEELTDEEIIEKLTGNRSNERKIGSSLQRTIKVYDIYQNGNLIFKDEASELSDLIIRKLISFKTIILDFSKISNISELFMRGTFEGITKFLTPEDLIIQIDIINISDENYLKIRSEIIPNCYKFWLSNLGENSNAYLEAKLDLIRTLDPDSEIILKNPKDYSIKHIPFQKLTSKYLKYQREKKLRYPIWYIERVTEEVIEIFEIDKIVENYIELILPEFDDTVIYNNCWANGSGENYQMVLPEDCFPKLYEFCEIVLLDSCSKYLDKLILEIEQKRKDIEDIKKILPSKLITAGGVCFQNLFLDDKLLNSFPEIVKIRLQKLEEYEFELLDLEHKYMIKEDILRNVFEEIPFTYYEIKLDKVKLIAYHYLAKFLEAKAIDFKSRHSDVKRVRGFNIPLEIFRFDLVKVLCDDKILRRFIFSMKELIEKWMFRYIQSSNLAKFYFDILMITPETLNELLLRAISLTIIKNKNPMTLRAVYSSYVALIHIMIDSNINLTDLSSKRYGCFSSLQNEYFKNKDYNTNLHYTQFKNSYPEEMLLKILLYKNFRALNDNYFIMKKLNFGRFLELDSLRVYITKPKDIGIYDWYWYYINFYQFIDKTPNYKIKNQFIRSNKRSSQLKIIEIMTHDILFDKVYNNIGDVDCVSEILGVIAEDISMRTLNNGYIDNSFKLTVKDNKDYLNYIHTALIAIRDNI